MSTHDETDAPPLPDWINNHLDEYAANPEKARLFDASPVGGHENTPTLLLTTKGRKTGRVLTMPLIYGETDTGFVVIASKGGAPTHPGWFHNLTAEPNVDIQVGAERMSVLARVAEDEERTRLWEMMTKVYPPYIEYRKKTDRKIPVVVLEQRQT